MTILMEFMERHQKVALLFSAGKDSAACLKLLMPWIEQVTVVWCNPGRPFPEVVEYMERIRLEVPHFMVALGEQPNWIAANGWPADVVPFEASRFGRRCATDVKDVVPLVPAVECRNANMWEPAMHAVRATGASGVIKGEKATDIPLALPVQTVYEGREYFRPLWAWTDADVMKFLDPKDWPPGYEEGLTGSLDCMTCTAWLARNPKRLRYLRVNHPKVFEEVAPVLRYMRESSQAHVDRLEGLT